MRWFIAVLWLASAASGTGQIPNGRGGVLFAKPYPWSSKNQVSAAYEFKVLEDHTGYYTLNPGPQQQQVQVGYVVEVLYNDELTIPSTIESEPDLAPLQAAETRLETLSEGSAIAQKALANRLTAIKTEIGYFRQGNFKINGQWVSASEVAKRRELEKTAQQQALVDTECNELMGILERRDLALERYVQAIERLKTLGNCHEIRVLQMVEQFQKDSAAASSFEADARTFLQKVAREPAMEALTKAKASAELPTLPSEISKTAEDLRGRCATLEHDLYYQTWRDRLRPDETTLSVLTHLSAVIVKLKAGEMRIAATEAAQLNPENHVGMSQDCPSLNAAVENTRGLVRSTLQAFASHCTRASELEKLGKSAEAIEEYKKAVAISNEPVILKKIQDLREQSLGL